MNPILIDLIALAILIPLMFIASYYESKSQKNEEEGEIDFSELKKWRDL